MTWMARRSVVAYVSVVVVGCGTSHVPQPSPIVFDAPADASSNAVPAAQQEVWSGTLVSPHDLVDIVVRFVGRETATLDVPAAKLAGLALDNVALSAEAIQFTLTKPSAPHASERYELARTGDTATGTVAIAGQTFHVKMRRVAPGAAPQPAITRTQTPRPPFPYAIRDVTISAPEDGELAGSLTIPAGAGPFPAVLLISGSGQQDRDETIFGHRPFAVIADRLTREGIAVLRTDDRGTGKTTGKLGSLATDIGDGRAAFEWLAKQPEIDSTRVGIIGHSIGGVIAPVIAARTQKVAFLVALAGPGVSGAELVPMQLEAVMTLSKVPAPIIKSVVAAQRKVGAAIARGKPAEITAALRASFVDAAAASGMPRPTNAQLDAAVAAKLPEVTNPWVISFFKTDPIPSWRKVKAPVLAVIGDKDLQVPADLNLSKVADTLRKAGNKDVTTAKRPGLNHLYQHASTGMTDEYAVIEETFDPETLDLVTNWLVDKARVKR